MSLDGDWHHHKHLGMSQAASQSAAFYREVAVKRRIWGIRDDDGGLPAPMTEYGYRAMPFWSSASRAHRATATTMYTGFAVFDLAWDEFDETWIPGLEGDGFRVGVNSTGPRMTGFDLSPADVHRHVDAAMALQPDRV